MKKVILFLFLISIFHGFQKSYAINSNAILTDEMKFFMAIGCSAYLLKRADVIDHLIDHIDNPKAQFLLASALENAEQAFHTDQDINYIVSDLTLRLYHHNFPVIINLMEKDPEAAFIMQKFYYAEMTNYAMRSKERIIKKYLSYHQQDFWCSLKINAFCQENQILDICLKNPDLQINNTLWIQEIRKGYKDFFCNILRETGYPWYPSEKYRLLYNKICSALYKNNFVDLIKNDKDNIPWENFTH